MQKNLSSYAIAYIQLGRTMSHILTSTRSHRAQDHSIFHAITTAAIHGLPHAQHYLRLTFISGPRQLLTSRISVTCAAFMAMMCAPALLFSSILTIPAMIFQSPQQNAYFHFSKVLEQDPTRWVVLLLAGLCAVMSMAVPATMPAPSETIEY
jgi:hypothetical protein